MAEESPALSPAKITDRFLAYLADLVPFLAAYYGSLYLLAVRLGRLPNQPHIWHRVFLAWLAVFLLYQTLGNMSGGTVGKRLLGIAVVGKDGRRLGFFRSALRAFGYLLSTPFCNLGFLWSFVDADSRTWHDLLAGSRVVERAGRSVGAATLSAVLSFVLLAAILGADAWFHLVRPSPADLEAVERAREGLGILAAVEESYKAGHGAYTSDIAVLAAESGDAAEFQGAMHGLFAPEGFELRASPDAYLIRARALDGKRTLVELAGPDFPPEKRP